MFSVRQRTRIPQLLSHLLRLQHSSHDFTAASFWQLSDKFNFVGHGNRPRVFRMCFFSVLFSRKGLAA